MGRDGGPQAPRGAGSGRPGAWRRVAVGTTVLAGVGLLLAFLWPRSEAGAPRLPADVDVAAPPPPVLPGAGAAAPEEELPEVVQRYLEATVYPPDSGRLTDDRFDLLHPNARYERPRPILGTISDDASGVVRTLLTADRFHLEAGAKARATLSAWRGEVPIPNEVAVGQAALWAESCAGEQGRGVPVAFVRRGEGLEADLPFLDLSDHHGFVRLDVQFTAGGDPEVQRGELRFFHTPAGRIPAEILPGRFRDRLHEGSLRLELGVNVRDPGFYRFDANLLGPNGEPVAFTHFKGELATGVQTVPLDVYGKVLRDAGVPGPYRVSGLRGYRFLDGKCPDRENIPGVEATFRTGSYALSAFTDAPHTSEHKQRMVELMLADEAAGIGPEVPELPPPGETWPPPPPDDDYEPPPPGSGAPRGS